MSRLLPGWYIVLYHDVSWEEGPFVRHIGGTCSPDVFRDHVRACKEIGELVSIENGMARLGKNEISTPLISFWFDDGLVGVRKYAAPILEEHGITGAISVCSRFLNREEMFWRFKMSYLQSIDAGRFLRSRLRRYGYSNSHSLRNFTIDKFGNDVLSVVNTLYDEAVSDEVQSDAFRIFETPQGLLELQARGWTIANHSAAHYPIGEEHVMDIMMQQFEECEKAIRCLTGMASKYWVFPFDWNLESRAIRLVREHRDCPIPVLVRNRVNVTSTVEAEGMLFRIDAPFTNRKRMIEVLFATAQGSSP